MKKKKKAINQQILISSICLSLEIIHISEPPLISHHRNELDEIQIHVERKTNFCSLKKIITNKFKNLARNTVAAKIPVSKN